MLEEIQFRLKEKQTFAIETTLANKGYFHLVKQAHLYGYKVVLYFFYLPSAEMAKARVAHRVSKGGHNIPPDVIERRYFAGIKNFFEYLSIVDNWLLYKNDITPPELIAQGELGIQQLIHKFDLWESLKTI